MPDAWLESEYSNRAKVPEHGAIMAGWQRDAAAFRAVHGEADIELKYGPSARQVLDIFWPGTDRDVPLAMFIHGGYWQALNKDFFSHLAAGFLGHGIALALPSYDLCPQVSLEVLTEQLREAAAFLIGRHGRNVYATGHSFGRRAPDRDVVGDGFSRPPVTWHGAWRHGDQRPVRPGTAGGNEHQ